MKIAVMQPYFFPYLGYFQLLNAVDTFVFFDNVNFIKKGFINRNRILLNGVAHSINLPINKISQNRHINEHTRKPQTESLVKTIQHAYSKAPFFEQVMPLLKACINTDEVNLAKYLAFQIEKICNYLEINCKLLYASELDLTYQGSGQEKILAIAEQLKATGYINPEGGKALYQKAQFANANIALEFLHSQNTQYPQFGQTFIEYLSIVDVLMFNSRTDIKSLLNNKP